MTNQPQPNFDEITLERIEDIKMMLGYPVVMVHATDDMISKNIKKAYRKFGSKVLDVRTISVPFSGHSKIDVVAYAKQEYDYDVELVTNVEPALTSSSGYSDHSTNVGVNEFDSRYLPGGANIENIAYNMLRRGSLNAITHNFDWEWEEPYLYVDNVPQGCSELSVQTMFADVEASYPTWVEDYALALTKIQEGRIRSKYQGGPMEFENDGTALVDEGTRSLEELEESLKSRVPMIVSRRA